jgi:nitrite reductase (NADH) large subunit
MSDYRRRRPRLVVIGNGMAGMRTVEELLSHAPDCFDITVVGAEPHPNYNRILLSSVLSGESTLDEIVINPHRWYDEHRVHLIAGKPVTAIDRSARQVTLVDASTNFLRQIGAGDRLEAAGAANPGSRPAQCARFPGHRRCRGDD